MVLFNADLHLHSPHSIAVSQQVSIPTLCHTAQQKGLNILASGDITQVNWRNSVKSLLEKRDGCFFYKDIAFILGTELEDADSIHHVVFLPDFHAAEVLQEQLSPFVKNIDGKWAGRPHVHRSPVELVDIIDNVGGICGPAHAFTPFKSLFRQGKYDTLKDAFQNNLSKIAFIELGLSANTFLADRISELSNYTFLSNSDAHSQESWSLGREFNRFDLNSPSFDEIKNACYRKKGNKVILNAGLDPRLGKYYKMFCRKCRKRIILTTISKNEPNPSDSFHAISNYSLKPEIDRHFINYNFGHSNLAKNFLQQVSKNQIICPSCNKTIEKDWQKLINDSSHPKRKPSIPKIKFGVSERIDELSTWDTPHHPSHRPAYVHIIPLIDILREIFKIKSQNSKTIMNAYSDLIKKYQTEYKILLEIPLEQIMTEFDGKLTEILQKIRNNEISIIPGGGGIFGELDLG